MDIVGTLTAPARLGFRVAGFGLRTLRGLLPGEEDGDPAPSAAPVDQVPRRRPAPRRKPEAPPKPVDEVAPVEDAPEPPHVDEGATVVAEFAESGAEEGAGAEVELHEPWDGYDGMTSDQILPHLLDATSESVAAVILYERFTRGRTSVIQEAERQLGRRTAPGPA